MKYIIFICYSLIQLFESGFQKPLRESSSHTEVVDKSGEGKRIRRSIPEFDAVNPLYTDYESLPDQEGSVDPQRAGFALTDHLSNIFRSQKPSKNNPKQAPKHASIDHPIASLTKDINSIDGEYLRTDEQEECYKQQNIAPPAVKETSLKRCSGTGVRNMPVIADKQRASYVRGNLLKDKGGKHYEVKEGEKTEITSLYSHPEKVYKPRKVKHYPQPKTPDLFNNIGRVYKPTDTEAQFPVYDGDLDFYPDPLQGILDDKYWLDPQDKEEVIKKYMDAAANIVPSELKISKRSNHAIQNKEKKNIDDQPVYKQSSAIEVECPCKQVVACGECSKGKARKKTNITGSYEEAISYGRKLLSIDYENNIEESRNNGGKDISSVNYEDLVQSKKEGTNEETQIDELIPSVTMDKGNMLEPLEKNEKEIKNIRNAKEEESIVNYEGVHLGRKLLWISEFDESYDDTDDDNEEYIEKNNPELVIDNNYNDPKRNNYQYDEFYSSASAYDTNDESPTNNNFIKDGNSEIQNVYPEDKQSKLYKPNKLANVLQKPLQKKAKGPPKKLPINTTLEFETLQNETLKNITGTERTTTSEHTLIPGEISTTEKKIAREENRSFNKRWDSNPSYGLNGRRRYAEHENTKNRIVAFAQNDDNVGDVGSKRSSDILNTTVTPLPSVSSSVSQMGNITPPAHPKNSTETMMQHTPLNHAKSVEEGDEDAQVATNIVNSVLLESQRSSVVGHNLGLCRRNESLVKVNYGKVIPETEKVLKTVTACIMDRLKNHLAKQSCIILDPELLEFLKWMVLSGESYKDYKLRLPSIYNFLPQSHLTHSNHTTCPPPQTTLPLCDPGMGVGVNNLSSVQSAISSVAPGVASQQVLK